MSNRNSVICIAKDINIDKNYKNTLALNKSQLMQLCQTNSVYMGTDYSFLRTEERIKVQAGYSVVYQGNYCYITNQGVTEFYFIDEIKYIADGTTEISVTQDVLSTYKDEGFKPAYCERQHAQDDPKYANRVAESITPSEYRVASSANIDVNPTEFKALFSEAWAGGDQFDPVPSAEVGILQNRQINTLHIVGGNLTNSNLQGFVSYYHNYIKNGKADDLVTIYTRPDPNYSGTMEVPEITRIDGYTPKNNKLFNYPYCLVHLTNNNGSTIDFKPELLDSRAFAYKCADNGKAVSFCYPAYYMNKANNTDYGLLIDNYPTIPVAVDSYTQWLGQATTGLAQGAIGSAVTAGISLALAPVTGGISLIGLAGAGMNLASQATEIATHPDNTPDSVKGLASGNIMARALNNFKFTIENHTIVAEEAVVIDDFFTRFGYAQNKLMPIDQTNPRFHCHFVKTAPGECVIHGIPHAKANIINAAFNSGITFWDANGNIGNYNLK